MSRLVCGAWFSLALAVAWPAWSQGPSPARPRLNAEADTNDWEAYYDHGVAALKRQPDVANAAFQWAMHLNPERAEPIFGLWVTLQMGITLGSNVQLTIDSVRLRSMIRNPFVHRGLELYALEVSRRLLRNKDLNRGLTAYANSAFDDAVEHLGRAIQRDPKDNLWFRTTRADAFVRLRQYDSALVEIVAIRDELERQDAAKTVVAYESKELIHYAIGMLEQVRGRTHEARESMARALVENLGFYPAHMFLADAAMDAGQYDDAIAEFEAAIQTSPADPVLYFHYGRALSNLGRNEAAIGALRKAVKIEPYYAIPWLFLGRMIEGKGDALGAIAAYRTFLNRAPRSDPNLPLARKWLADLQAQPR